MEAHELISLSFVISLKVRFVFYQIYLCFLPIDPKDNREILIKLAFEIKSVLKVFSDERGH